MSTSVTSRELKKWRLGAIRGLRKAQEFSGVSIQELRSLLSANALTAIAWGDRGDFMFSRVELMELLTKQAARAGVGARTAATAQNECKADRSSQTKGRAHQPAAHDAESSGAGGAVWASGAFAARYGAAYLSVSERTFLTIAREENWPRKKVRKKVVYPRSLVKAYLAACPDVEPLK